MMTVMTCSSFAHVGFLLASTVPLVVSAQSSAPTSSSMRGTTYCEVIWAGPLQGGQGMPQSATVSWNGTGGTCPTNPGYFNLTQQDVQAVHGDQADIVVWNGVRQWTLDQMILQNAQDDNAQTDDSVYYEYGTNIFPDGSGMTFRRQATLELSTGGAKLNQPYALRAVARNATAVWAASSVVYELIADDHCSQIYVMQSLMLGRPGDDHYMTAEDAKNYDPSTLATQLDLPEGWSFRQRVLAQDLSIVGDGSGVTRVLQDDRKNAYSAMDTAYLAANKDELCHILVDVSDGDSTTTGSESSSTVSSGTRRYVSVSLPLLLLQVVRLLFVSR